MEEALATLGEAMDRCLSLPLFARSSEQLVGYLDRLQAHQQRLAAIQAALVRELEVLEVPGRRGATSTVAWPLSRYRMLPGAVRQLACDGEMLPVVLSGTSQVLDVGRERRFVTTTIRRALIVRDKGCAFPGCGRPPRWCFAHHIQHWIDRGETSLENGVLLCGHHHGLIHHSEWTVRIEEGMPVFTPPDG